MARPLKTNAVRLLEAMGIVYALQRYDPGDGHLSAAAVAEQVGLEPDRVFKTLVAIGDRHGHCMAVIPASGELDLKALARAMTARKVALVPLDQVTPLTGYVRGGVTALAARKNFPVYLDESALSHPTVAVSGGRRGLQLVLSPQDYVRATGARVQPLVTVRASGS